ncbi:hypothetical protein K438DRAFT_1763024 [Mycena galopus ATCC 62051]|nr:hypothetical protein K438DRAFT_1763024 [Mycena galopus ATCC 62051]
MRLGLERYSERLSGPAHSLFDPGPSLVRGCACTHAWYYNGEKGNEKRDKTGKKRVKTKAREMSVSGKISFTPREAPEFGKKAKKEKGMEKRKRRKRTPHTRIFAYATHEHARGAGASQPSQAKRRVGDPSAGVARENPAKAKAKAAKTKAKAKLKAKAKEEAGGGHMHTRTALMICRTLCTKARTRAPHEISTSARMESGDGTKRGRVDRDDKEAMDVDGVNQSHSGWEGDEQYNTGPDRTFTNTIFARRSNARRDESRLERKAKQMRGRAEGRKQAADRAGKQFDPIDWLSASENCGHRREVVRFQAQMNIRCKTGALLEGRNFKEG